MHTVTSANSSERILQYRTATYVAVIRMDGPAVPETLFMSFARQTRDQITAELKAAG